MANKFYGAVALIGGGAGALDLIDGALLVDGDAATVQTDGTTYFYHLDATSGAAESSPDVIIPDTNAGTKRWILQSMSGVAGGVEYIRLWDSKSNGTNGGGTTSGVWGKRDITEDQDEGDNCTVTASVIVLAAGTYECFIRAPAFRVYNHAIRLYNTSDTATVLMGSTAYCHISYQIQTDSVINSRFTIGAAKNLEIQHRTNYTRATTGYGGATSYGETEIYTVAEFWKIS